MSDALRENALRVGKDTLVPLGLALSVIGGITWWMAKTEFNEAALARETASFEEREKVQTGDFRIEMRRIHEQLDRIESGLSNVEGQLAFRKPH